MKTAPASVCFAAEGQVVIPANFCREFQIENGTRVIVEATPDGILLKPDSRPSVRLRGIFAREPGDRPLAEEWAEHKASELALEEANYERATRGFR